MKLHSIFLLLIITGFIGCKKDSDDGNDTKPNPVADFIFSTGDGFAPDTIQFTNQSANAESYQWDFSDGSSSSETNPQHIFHSPGTYNVKLTATNTAVFAYVIKPVSVEPDTELTSARNYVLAESIFANVFTIAEEGASGCGSGILNTCSTIINDTVSAPRILTIDFGNTNCAGADQKLRRGKVIVSYTGNYNDSASVHQVSFDNFYESNHNIQGVISITNNGHNTSNHLNYSLTLNAKLYPANSQDSIIWNAQKTIEWIQGEGTSSFCQDDVYQITGNASGIIFRGKSFSSTITNAVLKQIICPPLCTGKINLTPFGKAVRIIDFGNGSCDFTVTVSLNGSDRNIPAY